MVTDVSERKDLKKLKRQMVPILRRHEVARAGIFGSVAEGNAQETSDIDVLVEFKGEKSLIDLVALKLALEEKTKRNVDVLTYAALHPLIKRKVLAQEVKVL